MDLIADIKSRLTILDVLSYLGVSVAGRGRNMFIHSIYKSEKTPSMCIYPKSNSYYCFATSAGGDIIDLYKDFYNIDARQAVKELAELAGLKDSKKDISSKAPARPVNKVVENFTTQGKDFLGSLSEYEKELYYERLGISEDQAATEHGLKLNRLEQNKQVFEELYRYCSLKGFNEKSLIYLCGSRKLEWDSLKRFKVFFINNYYEVNNHMKKSFPLEQLQLSGLYNRKPDGSGNLIFYQHRIIIPYLHRGEIIYLRGRYFDQDDSEKTDRCKYIGLGNDGLDLNTAKRFYNSDVLLKMLPGEKLYITEGEFDAIAIEQMGFNAICIPGAGNMPSMRQFGRLNNFEVVFCGDNDEAGTKLKNKLKELFLSRGKTLRVKNLPTKDVNEFLSQYE